MARAFWGPHSRRSTLGPRPHTPRAGVARSRTWIWLAGMARGWPGGGGRVGLAGLPIRRAGGPRCSPPCAHGPACGGGALPPHAGGRGDDTA